MANIFPIDFEEKLKIANKTLNWNYEPIEEAYHCLLFGGNMEDVDNRELTRYEESLENISIRRCGQTRLNASRLYWIKIR